MPDITVLERAGHTKWRALYYGSNIMGDDAAMYENSKKFIIRNDFDTSIYFIAYEK
jgi:vancomycin resistance protein YoaR